LVSSQPHHLPLTEPPSTNSPFVVSSRAASSRQYNVSYYSIKHNKRVSDYKRQFSQAVQPVITCSRLQTVRCSHSSPLVQQFVFCVCVCVCVCVGTNGSASHLSRAQAQRPTRSKAVSAPQLGSELKSLTCISSMFGNWQMTHPENLQISS
jgi:hypothetical protein